jgi:hypothetical protein
MNPVNSGGQRPSSRTGSHRKPTTRSVLTRTIAAGGAVVCIGTAYQVTTPVAHALSIVFHNPDGNGGTNEVRVNVFQGNIFDPQLALLGANVSHNSTGSNGTISTANNPLVDNFIFNNPITQLINAILNAEIVIGGAASGPINNTTQISFGSFNIFNPQASIFGGNLSNNTTNANKASGYGNNASATSVPNFWTSWFGGMAGNGNAFQLAFFSGNIFNPQSSLFGPNVSNNVATTNVAEDNGNYSQTSAMQGGLLGAITRFFFGGMTGNGNTTQVAVGTSNITNPQASLGGSNQSNNTAVTNEAAGNGNGSQTTVGGSGLSVGTTGSGNTNQVAVGTSNINNPQTSIGDIGLTPRPEQLAAQSGGTVTTGSNSLNSAGSPNSNSLVTSNISSGTPVTGSGTSGSTTSAGAGGATITSGTSGTSATTGTSGTSDPGGAGTPGGSGSAGGSGSE